jgi:hypothetical protein
VSRSACQQPWTSTTANRRVHWTGRRDAAIRPRSLRDIRSQWPPLGLQWRERTGVRSRITDLPSNAFCTACWKLAVQKLEWESLTGHLEERFRATYESPFTGVCSMECYEHISQSIEAAIRELTRPEYSASDHLTSTQPIESSPAPMARGNGNSHCERGRRARRAANRSRTTNEKPGRTSSMVTMSSPW